MKYTAREQVEFDWLVERGRTPDEAERAIMEMRGHVHERMHIRAHQITVERYSPYSERGYAPQHGMQNITIELVAASSEALRAALERGYLEVRGVYAVPADPLRE